MRRLSGERWARERRSQEELGWSPPGRRTGTGTARWWVELRVWVWVGFGGGAVQVREERVKRWRRERVARKETRRERRFRNLSTCQSILSF